MANSQVIFPGERMRAYFRAILSGEPGVAPGAVEGIAARCAAPIARMWVSHVPAPLALVAPGPAPAADMGAAPPAREPAPQPAASPAIDETGLDQIAPWFDETSGIPPSVLAGLEAAAEPATPHVPLFDPFAFSVVALLKRSGPDGLLARLGDIGRVEDLRALADAQHLAVADDVASAEGLRQAIVAAAQRRISDRHAAAS